MEALKTQIGGSHYKSMKIQPVELFAATKCTAFQANIWKYIIRYKQKNGKEDIEKAMHYAQLAIELKCNGDATPRNIQAAARFCNINNLSGYVTAIVMKAVINNYKDVIVLCKDLIAKEYPD